MPDLEASSPVRAIPPDAAEGPPEKGIALCLSGGGYRAMVFHVGALWRLNEAGILGRLRRVSSVSGGSITAGVLGMNWRALGFDAAGVATQFTSQLVDPIRAMAGRTVDEGSIIGGILLPGTISDKVAKAYDKYLFNGKTLQDLPDDSQPPSSPGAAPRFVINATNVQTGSLWRFSRPFMGDWQVGLIRNPAVSLAKAVAASSAFPPVLSPAHLDVDPGAFDPTTKGAYFTTPFNDEVVLSDGGVYDNLGLETAYKRLTTLLVSDGGQRMGAEPEPKGDWVQHSVRIMGVIDNQVRALRKRQLVQAFIDKAKTGAYWGIGTRFAEYNVTDPLGVGAIDTSPLAGVKTRLKAMEPSVQERLINWGYAICDAALRAYAADVLRAEYGLTLKDPAGLPYPGSGVG
jgi:NTE family protein